MNYSVSIILVVLMLIHHCFDLDLLSILLLLIATIPVLKKEYQDFINDCIYVLQKFKSIKIGPVEAELFDKEREEIDSTLETNGFLDQQDVSVKLENTSGDLYFSGEDPIEALQKFRSGIEQGLEKLAKKYSLEAQPLNDLIDTLADRKILKTSDQNILKRIVKLKIDKSLLERKEEILKWVNGVGKQLVEILDNWAGETRVHIGAGEDPGQPHPIDLEYKTVNTSKGTQQELTKNELHFIDKWKEEQKVLLKALQDSPLNDSTKSVIAKNQKDWEKYQKSFDGVLPKIDFSSNGSIMPFSIAKNKHQQERNRTLELEQIRKWFLDKEVNS
jgi:hypothetical protein